MLSPAVGDKQTELFSDFLHDHMDALKNVSSQTRALCSPFYSWLQLQVCGKIITHLDLKSRLLMFEDFTAAVDANSS